MFAASARFRSRFALRSDQPALFSFDFSTTTPAGKGRVARAHGSRNGSAGELQREVQRVQKLTEVQYRFCASCSSSCDPSPSTPSAPQRPHRLAPALPHAHTLDRSHARSRQMDPSKTPLQHTRQPSHPRSGAHALGRRPFQEGSLRGDGATRPPRERRGGSREGRIP